jgi:hypothetical protein
MESHGTKAGLAHSPNYSFKGNSHRIDVCPLNSGVRRNFPLEQFMRYFISLVLMLLSVEVRADTITLPISGESWALQMESPTLKELENRKSGDGYRFLGNADRLNVSFFVEPVRCAYGQSNDALYKCWLEKASKSPNIVTETIRSGAAPQGNGLIVAYLFRVDVDGKRVDALNAHYLFFYDGKQCDLHASFVYPAGEDANDLFALISSARIVDNDTAGSK